MAAAPVVFLFGFAILFLRDMKKGSSSVPYTNPNLPELPESNNQWVVCDTIPSQRTDQSGVVYTVEAKAEYAIDGGDRVDNDEEGNVQYSPASVYLKRVEYRVMKDGIATPRNPNVDMIFFNADREDTDIKSTQEYYNAVAKANELAAPRSDEEREYDEATEEEKQDMKEDYLDDGELNNSNESQKEREETLLGSTPQFGGGK